MPPLSASLIQSEQYSFPYHYIPSLQSKTYLSRHWGFAASYVAALRLIATELEPVASANLSSWNHLDIGCGDGALIKYLTAIYPFKKSSIYGIDMDARALQWARTFNPLSTFTCGPIDQIGIKFYSASLIEVLEHIHPVKLPGFLADCANSLHPDGTLVCTVPSAAKPVANKHYQHFTVKSLQSLLSPHFKSVVISGFEKQSILLRLIHKLRINSYLCIDSPILNNFVISKYSTLYSPASNCGRLFAVCKK